MIRFIGISSYATIRPPKPVRVWTDGCRRGYKHPRIGARQSPERAPGDRRELGNTVLHGSRWCSVLYRLCDRSGQFDSNAYLRWRWGRIAYRLSARFDGRDTLSLSFAMRFRTTERLIRYGAVGIITVRPTDGALTDRWMRRLWDGRQSPPHLPNVLRRSRLPSIFSKDSHPHLLSICYVHLSLCSSSYNHL